jgi:hypothetical protein
VAPEVRRQTESGGVREHDAEWVKASQKSQQDARDASYERLREARHSVEGVVSLMQLIGAQSVSNVEALPRPLRRQIQKLMQHFLYCMERAEAMEKLDSNASELRLQVVATALALRVMLRPECREVLLEEYARDEN